MITRYLLPVLLLVAMLLPILPTPVSASEVNITNIPSSYDFEVVNANSAYTTGLTTFNITNTGDVAVNISISGTNMAGGMLWVLDDTATPGADQFGLKAGISIGVKEEVQPNTVATSSNSYAVFAPFQRKAFYANNIFWIFFINSAGQLVYSTSPNGTSWASPTLIASEVIGDDFSVWFDGTYLYYAIAPERTSIKYRRGIPESNGTVTWSQAEQTVATSDNIRTPFVCIDTAGYPWVGYMDYVDFSWCGFVSKSSTNNGTWSNDTGFPYQLSTDDAKTYVSIVPLTSAKMYVLYFLEDTSQGWGRLWNSTAMGSEELIVTDDEFEAAIDYSAVSQDDDVHIVFCTYPSKDIVYRERTYGVGWEDRYTVQDGAGLPFYEAPVISIDTNTNNLYVFWQSYPGTHIFYRKYDAGTSIWETAIAWITETDALTYDNRFSSFYQSYGNYIGLVYMTKTSAPYNIRFSALASIGDYDVIVKKDSPYNNLVINLGVGNNTQWGLELYTPTSYSDGHEKSETVTLTATEVGNSSNVSYIQVDIYSSPNFQPPPTPASVTVIRLTTVAFVIFGIVIAFTYFRTRLIETVIALMLTAVGAIILLQVLTVLVD